MVCRVPGVAGGDDGAVRFFLLFHGRGPGLLGLAHAGGGCRVSPGLLCRHGRLYHGGEFSLGGRHMQYTHTVQHVSMWATRHL